MKNLRKMILILLIGDHSNRNRLLIAGSGIVVGDILIKAAGGSNYAYLGWGIPSVVISVIILVRDAMKKREENDEQSASDVSN